MAPIAAYSKRDLPAAAWGPSLKIIVIVVVLVILFLIGFGKIIWRRFRRSRLETERDIVDVEQPTVETESQPTALEHSPTYVSESDPPPVYSK
ncbi:hypothetical protein NQZ79_g1628 [Umbelopsis isabellina]|nr:hypothetical protein NQZ79_g1628 [Umbelopsis isabellina]